METALSQEILETYLPYGAVYPVVLAETDSTNAQLKRLAAEGVPEGSAVFARCQTSGRGRLGRSFASPPGGMYVSVLWRPEACDRLFCLTALAAVAVCRALSTVCGVETQIKWRNDLLLGGKKLCGILTELLSGSNGINAAVIGIGINVNTPVFAPELHGKATSLLLETGRVTDENVLAAALLRELGAAREALRGNCEAYMTEYAAACVTVGRRVLVLRGDQTRPALAIGLDDCGALRVRYDDGTEETISTGEASIRNEDGDYV